MKPIFFVFSIILLLIAGGGALAENAVFQEIAGGQVYIGNFDGLEENTLYIKLSETGYRISLPISEETEWVYKPNNYVPYNPKNLIYHAVIKAIVVEEHVEQVIVLEVPS